MATTASLPAKTVPKLLVLAQQPIAPRLINGAVLTLVIAGSFLAASLAYQQYRDMARERWGSAVSDRNAHYLFGLSLALDIQQGDWKQLFSDFDGARTWPPLHGMLVALTLLAGGLDHQLAVLPSLAGWVGTIVFGFLVARRIAPRAGNWAGLTAVVFILSSPAHRVYATDIMLESLGACLSLIALYCYLVAKQDESVWAERGLGLALTALFLQKYNYWLLVCAALILTEILARPGDCWRFCRDTWNSVDKAHWLRSQFRKPLNYVVVLLLLLLAWVVLGNGRTITIGHNTISLHSPHNILHLAYLAFFLQLLLWWRKSGRDWASNLNRLVGRLILWHGIPIAVWFLFPKRLGYWLWYIAANKGENPKRDVLGGVSFYASSFVNDYHIGLWSALVALGCFILAFIAWRRLPPGGRAVLIFVLLSTLVTLPHPNRKSRFLHSWLAAGWAVGGAGLAAFIHCRATARSRNLRPWLAGAGVGCLALAHLPCWADAGHSPERGQGDYLSASTCDLTDCYLPWLAESHRTMFLSTMEIKHLFRWSFLEHYRQRERMEVDMKGFSATGEGNREFLDQWLQTTSCDTIILLDIPPGSYFYELTRYNDAFLKEIRPLLASQTLFHPVRQRYFSRYGCTVTMLTR